VSARRADDAKHQQTKREHRHDAEHSHLTARGAVELTRQSTKETRNKGRVTRSKSMETSKSTR